MTSAANGTKPPSQGASAVIAISVVLAMGLSGLAFYLRYGALRAEGELARSKEEHEKMLRMKRQIEELKKNAPRLAAVEKGGEDLLQLLASKARQANIPQNMLTASRNPDRKEGGWKEITYTVNLRATSKDNLVLRSSVVDFLALVERERPSVKAKNLALVFSGNDFTSATITFSLFQRESS